MKIFCHCFKSDDRLDVPTKIIVAETKERAEEMVSEWYKGSRWEEYIERGYEVREFTPTREYFLVAKSEDFFRWTQGQGIDGIGFASLPKLLDIEEVTLDRKNSDIKGDWVSND